jgi:hypothetical protein
MVVGAGVLLCGVSNVGAAIQTVADPTLPTPEEAAVFTVNVFDTNVVTNTGQRGVANTRNIRQTFQLDETIAVSDIIIGLDVVNPTDGLDVRIYEVNDVNGTWAPGNLVRELEFLSPANSSQWLGISFTDGDEFELMARNTGAQGYGIELHDLTEGANLGPVTHTLVDNTDFYPNGRYYSESGGGGFEFRDLGIILIGGDATPRIPGDVNGDMMVDIEIDLAAIAANFRTAGNRSLGDLTGNGFIDFDDFDQWKQNFDGAFPEGFSLDFANVPEPGSALLALVAMLGLAPVAGCRQRAARRCD